LACPVSSWICTFGSTWMTVLIQNKKCRTSIIKNTILDPSIRNSKICTMDSEIYNWKKSFLIHQSVIEIRLPNSAIQKSTIYVNFASGTPPHPESNMIHFQIDESITHFQIPISNKRWRSILRYIKLWGCRKKNVGMQEETAKYVLVLAHSWVRSKFFYHAQNKSCNKEQKRKQNKIREKKRENISHLLLAPLIYFYDPLFYFWHPLTNSPLLQSSSSVSRFIKLWGEWRKS